MYWQVSALLVAYMPDTRPLEKEEGGSEQGRRGRKREGGREGGRKRERGRGREGERGRDGEREREKKEERERGKERIKSVGIINTHTHSLTQQK